VFLARPGRFGFVKVVCTANDVDVREITRGKIEMKKMLFLSMALIFVITASSFGSAEEVKTKGKVTGINGEQITITDDQGREMTVEIAAADLKVGDAVQLNTEIEKVLPPFELKLSQEDIDFLTQQCHIDPADIDVIPKLNRRAKITLKAYLAERDCTLMEPFKNTREFLKKFTPPPDISPLPPRGYSRDYLTEEEVRYILGIEDSISAFKTKWMESRIKGKIAGISGNHVTITDDKGKQIAVESNATNLKVGDDVILKIRIFPL
jgi:hypothetical protein